MKITDIQLKIEGDYAVLSADCDIRHFGSDRIYFKFDKKYQSFIPVDASPFAAALLVPAMRLGHDLIIKGAISEKLYHGLREIMAIMLSWNIGLKPIAVLVDEVRKDSYKPTKNATFFSGGVDSSYTYFKHKASGKEKIDYFILVNGYDVTLGNTTLWDMTRNVVETIAKEENIELIKIESNVRNLIEPIVPWGFTFGGCLAALGLALRKELKNIYIPSAVKEDQSSPWGSHPGIDHLRGTETLSFHHDGVDVTRFQKVKFISQNPTVLKNLRVCFLNKKGKFNCGVCEKCLRTMISLRASGTLEQSWTFPRTLDLERVKKMKIAGEHGAIFHGENLVALEEANIDPALQGALREALEHRNPPKSKLFEIAKKIWFLDYYYNRGRLYMIVNFFRRELL